MNIIFRSDKGKNLTPNEVDNNFRLIVEYLNNFEILDSDKFIIDLNDNITINESINSYYYYNNSSGIGVDYLYIDIFLKTFSGQSSNDRFLINKNGTIQNINLSNWIGGDINNKSITSFVATSGSTSNSMYIENNNLTINTNNLNHGDIIDLVMHFDSYYGLSITLNLFFYVNLA